MTIGSIERLREIDRSLKPAGADEEWILGTLYYEDRSRSDTLRRLRQLGVGLKDNDRPIEVPFLRRLIDRIAVVYDSAPSRWLTKNDEPIPESSAAHVALHRALRRAQYNDSWKRVDRIRTLHRQSVIRFYPSDARGSVVSRVFEPHNVMREPDESLGDMLDGDRQFALLLSKSGEREVWEHWENHGGMIFTCLVKDERGTVIARPYESTSDVCPYGEIPVQIVYDEAPQGRPWLSPRASRVAFAVAINAIANDLHSLVVHQAHARTVTFTDNPEGVPKQTSHGGVLNLERNDRFEIHTPSPAIAQCQALLKEIIKLACLGEDLPIADFDDSKQVVTGAALLVQERALVARREALISLAIEDERAAFRRFRAVHNLHAMQTGTRWDIPALPEELELEIEIGDVAQPIDIGAMQDAAFRDIAIGAASLVDYVQRRDGVSREIAQRTLRRVSTDATEFPAGEIVTSEGPQTAKPSDIANEAAGLGFAERAKVASVVDAVALSS